MAETGVVAGGRLTDWISLGVLACWVPADAVDDAIEVTGKRAQRKGGKLPPRVVAYLVLALALFAGEDCEEVAARLAGTFADRDGGEESWGRAPASGGITQARQRLGPEPVAELFSQVARPAATMETARAFLGRWRLMSIDEMAWDVPGTSANAAAFGYPRAGKDGSPGAFPQAQLVTVSECASHAAVLAAIGPYALKGAGERALARRLCPGLDRGWLLIAGRGFYDWQDWCAAADTGAALLGRFKSGIRLPVLEILPDGSCRSVLVTPKATAAARPELAGAARAGEDLDPARARHVRVIEYEVTGRDREDEPIALVTTITDLRDAPAAALAPAGHDRWEHETASAQLKTVLQGPGRVLRPESPDMIKQEIWGYLLTRHALSALICAAATSAGTGPDKGEVQQDDPRRPPPGRRPGFFPLTRDSTS